MKRIQVASLMEPRSASWVSKRDFSTRPLGVHGYRNIRRHHAKSKLRNQGEYDEHPKSCYKATNSAP